MRLPITLRTIFLTLLSCDLILLLVYINITYPSLVVYFRLRQDPQKQLEKLYSLQWDRTREGNAHFHDVIETEARSAPYIEVGTCTPFPQIYKANLHSKIIFNNSDSRTHAIDFGNGKRLEIPPHKAKSMQNSASILGDIRGYSCDSSPQAVGWIYIADY